MATDAAAAPLPADELPIESQVSRARVGGIPGDRPEYPLPTLDDTHPFPEVERPITPPSLEDSRALLTRLTGLQPWQLEAFPDETPPLPVSRPTSPDLQTPEQPPSSPLAQRRLSSTSIPIRFRRPLSGSPGKDLTLDLKQVVSPGSSPLRPSGPRHAASSSGEFKTSREFRPLYLVERNRKSTEIDEVLPALPSSGSPSQASSTTGTEDDYQSALESPHLSTSDAFEDSFMDPMDPYSLISPPRSGPELQHPELAGREIEEIDESGQSTPKASSFPAGVLTPAGPPPEDLTRKLEDVQSEKGASPLAASAPIDDLKTRARSRDLSPSKSSSLLQDAALGALVGGATAAMLKHRSPSPAASDVQRPSSRAGSDFDFMGGDLDQETIEEAAAFAPPPRPRSPEQPTLSPRTPPPAKKGKKARKGSKGKSLDLGAGSGEVKELTAAERQKMREVDTADAVDDWFSAPVEEPKKIEEKKPEPVRVEAEPDPNLLRRESKSKPKKKGKGKAKKGSVSSPAESPAPTPIDERSEAFPVSADMEEPAASSSSSYKPFVPTFVDNEDDWVKNRAESAVTDDATLVGEPSQAFAASESLSKELRRQKVLDTTAPQSDEDINIRRAEIGTSEPSNEFDALAKKLQGFESPVEERSQDVVDFKDSAPTSTQAGTVLTGSSDIQPTADEPVVEDDFAPVSKGKKGKKAKKGKRGSQTIESTPAALPSEPEPEAVLPAPESHQHQIEQDILKPVFDAGGVSQFLDTSESPQIAPVESNESAITSPALAPKEEANVNVMDFLVEGSDLSTPAEVVQEDVAKPLTTTTSREVQPTVNNEADAAAEQAASGWGGKLWGAFGWGKKKDQPSTPEPLSPAVAPAVGEKVVEDEPLVTRGDVGEPEASALDVTTETEPATVRLGAENETAVDNAPEEDVAPMDAAEPSIPADDEWALPSSSKKGKKGKKSKRGSLLVEAEPEVIPAPVNEAIGRELEKEVTPLDFHEQPVSNEQDEWALSSSTKKKDKKGKKSKRGSLQVEEVNEPQLDTSRSVQGDTVFEKQLEQPTKDVAQESFVTEDSTASTLKVDQASIEPTLLLEAEQLVSEPQPVEEDEWATLSKKKGKKGKKGKRESTQLSIPVDTQPSSPTTEMSQELPIDDASEIPRNVGLGEEPISAETEQQGDDSQPTPEVQDDDWGFTATKKGKKSKGKKGVQSFALEPEQALATPTNEPVPSTAASDIPTSFNHPSEPSQVDDQLFVTEKEQSLDDVSTPVEQQPEEDWAVPLSKKDKKKKGKKGRSVEFDAESSTPDVAQTREEPSLAPEPLLEPSGTYVEGDAQPTASADQDDWALPSSSKKDKKRKGKKATHVEFDVEPRIPDSIETTQERELLPDADLVETGTDVAPAPVAEDDWAMPSASKKDKKKKGKKGKFDDIEPEPEARTSMIEERSNDLEDSVTHEVIENAPDPGRVLDESTRNFPKVSQQEPPAPLTEETLIDDSVHELLEPTTSAPIVEDIMDDLPTSQTLEPVEDEWSMPTKKDKKKKGKKGKPASGTVTPNDLEDELDSRELAFDDAQSALPQPTAVQPFQDDFNDHGKAQLSKDDEWAMPPSKNEKKKAKREKKSLFEDDPTPIEASERSNSDAWLADNSEQLPSKQPDTAAIEDEWAAPLSKKDKKKMKGKKVAFEATTPEPASTSVEEVPTFDALQSTNASADVGLRKLVVSEPPFENIVTSQPEERSEAPTSTANSAFSEAQTDIPTAELEHKQEDEDDWAVPISKKDKKKGKKGKRVSAFDEEPSTPIGTPVEEFKEVPLNESNALPEAFERAQEETPDVNTTLPEQLAEEQVPEVQEDEWAPISKKDKKKGKKGKRVSILETEPSTPFAMPTEESENISSERAISVPEASDPMGQEPSSSASLISEEAKAEQPVDEWAPISKKDKKKGKKSKRTSTFESEPSSPIATPAEELKEPSFDDEPVSAFQEADENKNEQPAEDDWAPISKKDKKKGKKSKRASTFEDEPSTPLSTAIDVSASSKVPILASEVQQPADNENASVSKDTEEPVVDEQRALPVDVAKSEPNDQPANASHLDAEPKTEPSFTVEIEQPSEHTTEDRPKSLDLASSEGQIKESAATFDLPQTTPLELNEELPTPSETQEATMDDWGFTTSKKGKKGTKGKKRESIIETTIAETETPSVDTSAPQLEPESTTEASLPRSGDFATDDATAPLPVQDEAEPSGTTATQPEDAVDDWGFTSSSKKKKGGKKGKRVSTFEELVPEVRVPSALPEASIAEPTPEKDLPGQADEALVELDATQATRDTVLADEPLSLEPAEPVASTSVEPDQLEESTVDDWTSSFKKDKKKGKKGKRQSGPATPVSEFQREDHTFNDAPEVQPDDGLLDTQSQDVSKDPTSFNITDTLTTPTIPTEPELPAEEDDWASAPISKKDKKKGKKGKGKLSGAATPIFEDVPQVKAGSSHDAMPNEDRSVDIVQTLGDALPEVATEKLQDALVEEHGVEDAQPIATLAGEDEPEVDEWALPGKKKKGKKGKKSGTATPVAEDASEEFSASVPQDEPFSDETRALDLSEPVTVEPSGTSVDDWALPSKKKKGKKAKKSGAVTPISETVPEGQFEEVSSATLPTAEITAHEQAQRDPEDVTKPLVEEPLPQEQINEQSEHLDNFFDNDHVRKAPSEPSSIDETLGEKGSEETFAPVEPVAEAEDDWALPSSSKKKAKKDKKGKRHSGTSTPAIAETLFTPTEDTPPLEQESEQKVGESVQQTFAPVVEQEELVVDEWALPTSKKKSKKGKGKNEAQTSMAELSEPALEPVQITPEAPTEDPLDVLEKNMAPSETDQVGEDNMADAFEKPAFSRKLSKKDKKGKKKALAFGWDDEPVVESKTEDAVISETPLMNETRDLQATSSFGNEAMEIRDAPSYEEAQSRREDELFTTTEAPVPDLESPSNFQDVPSVSQRISVEPSVAETPEPFAEDEWAFSAPKKGKKGKKDKKTIRQSTSDWTEDAELKASEAAESLPEQQLPEHSDASATQDGFRDLSSANPPFDASRELADESALPNIDAELPRDEPSFQPEPEPKLDDWAPISRKVSKKGKKGKKAQETMFMPSELVDEPLALPETENNVLTALSEPASAEATKDEPEDDWTLPTKKSKKDKKKGKKSLSTSGTITPVVEKDAEMFGEPLFEGVPATSSNDDVLRSEQLPLVEKVYMEPSTGEPKASTPDDSSVMPDKLDMPPTGAGEEEDVFHDIPEESLEPGTDLAQVNASTGHLSPSLKAIQDEVADFKQRSEALDETLAVSDDPKPAVPEPTSVFDVVGKLGKNEKKKGKKGKASAFDWSEPTTSVAGPEVINEAQDAVIEPAKEDTAAFEVPSRKSSKKDKKKAKATATAFSWDEPTEEIAPETQELAIEEPSVEEAPTTLETQPTVPEEDASGFSTPTRKLNKKDKKKTKKTAFAWDESEDVPTEEATPLVVVQSPHEPDSTQTDVREVVDDAEPRNPVELSSSNERKPAHPIEIPLADVQVTTQEEESTSPTPVGDEPAFAPALTRKQSKKGKKSKATMFDFSDPSPASEEPVVPFEPLATAEASTAANDDFVPQPSKKDKKKGKKKAAMFDWGEPESVEGAQISENVKTTETEIDPEPEVTREIQDMPSEPLTLPEESVDRRLSLIDEFQPTGSENKPNAEPVLADIATSQTEPQSEDDWALPVKKSKKEKRKSKSTAASWDEGVEEVQLSTPKQESEEPSFVPESTFTEQPQPLVEDDWALPAKKGKKEKRKSRAAVAFEEPMEIVNQSSGLIVEPATEHPSDATSSTDAHTLDSNKAIGLIASDVAKAPAIEESFTSAQPSKKKGKRHKLAAMFEPDTQEVVVPPQLLPTWKENTTANDLPDVANESAHFEAKEEHLTTDLESQPRTKSPEQDFDFAATVAAGLKESGFDTNLVLNDPSFHRSTSPLGARDVSPVDDIAAAKEVASKSKYGAMGRSLSPSSPQIDIAKPVEPLLSDPVVATAAENAPTFDPLDVLSDPTFSQRKSPPGVLEEADRDELWSSSKAKKVKGKKKRGSVPDTPVEAEERTIDLSNLSSAAQDKNIVEPSISRDSQQGVQQTNTIAYEQPNEPARDPQTTPAEEEPQDLWASTSSKKGKKAKKDKNRTSLAHATFEAPAAKPSVDEAPSDVPLTVENPAELTTRHLELDNSSTFRTDLEPTLSDQHKVDSDKLPMETPRFDNVELQRDQLHSQPQAKVMDDIWDEQPKKGKKGKSKRSSIVEQRVESTTPSGTITPFEEDFELQRDMDKDVIVPEQVVEEDWTSSKKKKGKKSKKETAGEAMIVAAGAAALGAMALGKGADRKESEAQRKAEFPPMYDQQTRSLKDDEIGEYPFPTIPTPNDETLPARDMEVVDEWALPSKKKGKKSRKNQETLESMDLGEQQKSSQSQDRSLHTMDIGAHLPRDDQQSTDVVDNNAIHVSQVAASQPPVEAYEPSPKRRGPSELSHGLHDSQMDRTAAFFSDHEGHKRREHPVSPDAPPEEKRIHLSDPSSSVPYQPIEPTTSATFPPAEIRETARSGAHSVTEISHLNTSAEPAVRGHSPVIEPTWSFGGLRDSAVHVADSPVLPSAPQFSTTTHTRDSGYHDSGFNPSLPQDPTDVVEESHTKKKRHSREPTTPRHAADRSITEHYDEHDRSGSPSLPELPSLADVTSPNAIDSSTKERTSYLFNSSPSSRQYGESPAATSKSRSHIVAPLAVAAVASAAAGTAGAHRSKDSDDVSRNSKKTHTESRERNASPTREVKHTEPYRPLFGDPSEKKYEKSAMLSTPTSKHMRTPNSQLDPIKESSPDDTLLHKKGRSVADVGTPDRGVKSARRSAISASKPVSERMHSPPPVTPTPASRKAAAPSVDASTPSRESPWHQAHESVDRSMALSPARRLPSDQRSTPPTDPTKQRMGEHRSPSALSDRSARFRSPNDDRPLSAASNRSLTPSLRRIDRSKSGDLRSASSLGEVNADAKSAHPNLAGIALAAGATAAIAAGIASSSKYDPFKDKGKGRAEMPDVYVSFMHYLDVVVIVTNKFCRRHGVKPKARRCHRHGRPACASDRACSSWTCRRNSNTLLHRTDR